MATTAFINRFDEAIKFAIKDAIAQLTKAAIKEAQEKIESDILKDIDKIALNLAKEYSVQDMGTHLVIHVKKGL